MGCIQRMTVLGMNLLDEHGGIVDDWFGFLFVLILRSEHIDPWSWLDIVDSCYRVKSEFAIVVVFDYLKETYRVTTSQTNG